MPYLGNTPVAGENNSFKLLDDITTHTRTFDGSSSSIVSVGDNTILLSNHRFISGQKVTYTHGGGGNIGGLTSGNSYYIIKTDQNLIKLASSPANVITGTAIDITSVGSGGSHTLNVAFDGYNTKFKATYDGGTRTKITRAAQLSISINGVIQRPTDDLFPTSGFGIDADNAIIFSEAPQSSDIFWGLLFGNNFPTFDISDNTIDTFTGDGITTVFTLSKIATLNENVLVTIDGVIQYPSDSAEIRAYSVGGNLLSFSSPPGDGSEIQVRHIGFAGANGGGGGGTGGVTAFYGRTGSVTLTTIDAVNVESLNSVNQVTLTGSPFVRNIPTISSNYTISPTYNEMSIGPITIGVGVSVIVQSGATWTIV
jgi:hypothetical protein